jgi:hypothetical protein
VTLLTDLDAFYLDHRRCGELDAGVAANGERIQIPSAGIVFSVISRIKEST